MSQPSATTAPIATDEFGEPAKPAAEPKTKAAATKPAAPAPPKMNVRTPPAIALPKELEAKKAMVAYVQQWGFTPEDYKDLSYTDKERAAFTAFSRKNTRIVPKELFTTALRMWHAGPTPGSQYPIVKASNTSLDEMAIN